MANLSRFDPFREMLTLREAVDRLFEDSIVSPASLRTLGNDTGQMLNPPLDLHQTDDGLVLTMALPGVKPEDVSITITGQVLQIRGEFKADESLKRDDYLYRERRFGSFNRQIELPVRVQGDAAQAEFEDGVLTLRVPKAAEVKPRQIEVRAASKPVAAANGSASGATA
ncbi:MAG TPA: Hsp20/alpha crystallin family protein [Candidatus Limnocylindria bacterium]|nr:Hsp20/alpha crystallin family protein [Candidatus Limnocylindria bacterium]